MSAYDGIKFNVSIIYGYSEARQFAINNDGVITNYSYRIDYDKDGVETNRTMPEILSYLYIR